MKFRAWGLLRRGTSVVWRWYGCVPARNGVIGDVNEVALPGVGVGCGSAGWLCVDKVRRDSGRLCLMPRNRLLALG